MIINTFKGLYNFIKYPILGAGIQVRLITDKSQKYVIKRLTH